MKSILLVIYLVNYSVYPNTAKMIITQNFMAKNYVAAHSICEIEGKRVVGDSDNLAFKCVDMSVDKKK